MRGSSRRSVRRRASSSSIWLVKVTRLYASGLDSTEQIAKRGCAHRTGRYLRFWRTSILRRQTRMFEEAQLYSPVTKGDDGTVEVHLGKDHPGFNDPVYRERRNDIAAGAMAWSPGEPIPRVAYSEVENGIWRTVCRELHVKHEKYA